MSTDPKVLLSAVPQGSGRALDLGGGAGALQGPLEQRGYRYANVDISRRGTGGPLVLGDAQRLPFKGGSFSLVVSNDSLEHFLKPHEAACEVQRVLEPGGVFVAQVPFMHPFHGNDTYRYTPLGLRYLLAEVAGLAIVRLESPLGVLSLLAYLAVSGLQKIGLGFLEKPLRTSAREFDMHFGRGHEKPSAYAAAYLVVAQRPKTGHGDQR